MNSQNKVFSERLKSLLKKKNMTQTELSEKTGISQGAISQYLMGAYEPKIENLRIIADKLDTNIGYLLGINDFSEINPSLKVLNRLLDLTINNKINWNTRGEDDYYVTLGNQQISIGKQFRGLQNGEYVISMYLEKNNGDEEELLTCVVNTGDPLEELFDIVTMSNSVNADILDILDKLDELDKEED